MELIEAVHSADSQSFWSDAGLLLHSTLLVKNLLLLMIVWQFLVFVCCFWRLKAPGNYSDIKRVVKGGRNAQAWLANLLGRDLLEQAEDRFHQKRLASERRVSFQNPKGHVNFTIV